MKPILVALAVLAGAAHAQAPTKKPLSENDRRVSANAQRGIGFGEMVQIALQLAEQEAKGAAAKH